MNFIKKQSFLSLKPTNIYTLDFFYNNNFYISYLTNRWNVYMSFYILYKSQKYYLYNIYKAVNNLKRSVFFLIAIAFNRGKVFLIDSNKKFKKFFILFKKITKQFFFGFKWTGGLFTNFKEFFVFQHKKEDRQFQEFKPSDFWIQDKNKLNRSNYFNLKKEGFFQKLKDLNLNEFRLLKKKGYFRSFRRLPDVGLFFDIQQNFTAVTELQLLGIPIITLVNAEDNPSGLNFVLFGKKKEFYVSFFYLSIFIEGIILGYIFEKNFFFHKIRRFYYLKFIYFFFKYGKLRK